MTKEAVLDIIANNNNYRNYCKALCNGRDIWKDLYQEFILLMCEKTEEQLVKMYNDNVVAAYCNITISNLNLTRHRYIKRKGNDNTLLELCNKSNELSFNIIDDEDYQHWIDEKCDEVLTYLENDKSIKMGDVAILFESLDNFVSNIAKNNNTSAKTIYVGLGKLKKRIRENVRL